MLLFVFETPGIRENWTFCQYMCIKGQSKKDICRTSWICRKVTKMLKILIVQEPQVVLYPSSVSFLTIFGTEKSNLKKSRAGGTGN